jgi:tetratricopeptide (TPR) repeat protein
VGARVPADRDPTLSKAKEAVAKLLASGSTAPRHELMSRVLAELKDQAGAVAEARAAVAADAKASSSKLLLGTMLVSYRMNLDEAAALGAAVVADDPERAFDGWSLQATAYANKALSLKEGDAKGADEARAKASKALRAMAAFPVRSFSVLGDMALKAETANDLELAISLYERAIKPDAGGVGMNLSIIKNNLSFLLMMAHVDGASQDGLRRARTLAEEAVASNPVPGFYETLGAVCARLSDRDAAIRAYRRSLDLDASGLAASVGLADMLASGGDADRREAATIVKRVDEAVAAGKRLSEMRATQFADAKRKLLSTK